MQLPDLGGIDAMAHQPNARVGEQWLDDLGQSLAVPFGDWRVHFREHQMIEANRQLNRDGKPITVRGAGAVQIARPAKRIGQPLFVGQLPGRRGGLHRPHQHPIGLQQTQSRESSSDRGRTQPMGWSKSARQHDGLSVVWAF